MIKNNKGITLISLVVTIIVLLILAGVAIVTLTGDNGIITRTSKAKKLTKDAEITENIKLAFMNAQIGKYAGKRDETFTDVIKDELENVYGENSVSNITDNGNDTYTLTLNVNERRKTLSIGTFDIVDGNDISVSGKIASGTTVYVRFTVSEGTDIVVKDSNETVIPLQEGYYKKAITENGTYSFKVTGTVEGENVELTPSTEVSIFSNIPAGLAIGKIIKYEPEGTYQWNAEYATSYATNTTNYTNASKTLQTGNSITQGNQDMSITRWKILSIDGENIKMVPTEKDYSSNATNKVTLHGAQGYNNAVNLLDEACSALYSNSSKGITAASIDITDIETLMDNTALNIDSESTTLDWQKAKETYSSGGVVYNNQYSTQYNATNSKYPVLYGQEKLRAIGSTTPSTAGLDVFEKPSSKVERNTGTTKIGAIDGTDNTKLNPVQTYYYFANSNFSNYLGETYSRIILPNGSSTQYWVASRCVGVNSSICGFGVRFVNSGDLSANYVFSSNGGEIAPAYALFPVVSLSSELLKEKTTNETGYDYYVK